MNKSELLSSLHAAVISAFEDDASALGTAAHSRAVDRIKALLDAHAAVSRWMPDGSAT